MSRLRTGVAVCAIASLGVVPAVAQSDPEEGSGGVGPDSTAIAAASPPPSETAEPSDKPFKSLFPNLFSDLRRLPSKDSAIVFGVGALLSLAAHPVDDYVTEHASAGGTDQIFAVGGGFGSGYTQAGGAIAAYAIGRLTKHPALSHVGADLIRAQVLSGFVTHGLKLAVRRDRPGGEHGRVPATYSFPSAHASATWTSATVLWRHLGWKAGVPASILAVYASGARVQERQHFLSDVLFGASIGIASARTITVGHRGRTLIVTPTAIAGGAAAIVTVVDR